MSTGKSAAKRAAKTSQEAIRKQQQLESTRIAEEEDAIARRRNLAKTGGRSLLVKTSPQGVKSNNLGGTL